jgi:hypothetical protein
MHGEHELSKRVARQDVQLHQGRWAGIFLGPAAESSQLNWKMTGTGGPLCTLTTRDGLTGVNVRRAGIRRWASRPGGRHCNSAAAGFMRRDARGAYALQLESVRFRIAMSMPPR